MKAVTTNQVYPSLKGQMFVTQFSENKKLTVESFWSDDDKPYDSLSKCRKANGPNSKVYIVNKEHGGLTELERTFLIK